MPTRRDRIRPGLESCAKQMSWHLLAALPLSAGMVTGVRFASTGGAVAAYRAGVAGEERRCPR
jgi:hypothetical protein